MEQKHTSIIQQTDDTDIFKAFEFGLSQCEFQQPAMQFEKQVDYGKQIIAGIDNYQCENKLSMANPIGRPKSHVIEKHLEKYYSFRSTRNQFDCRCAQTQIQRTGQSKIKNIIWRSSQSLQFRTDTWGRNSHLTSST